MQIATVEVVTKYLVVMVGQCAGLAWMGHGVMTSGRRYKVVHDAVWSRLLSDAVCVVVELGL